MNEQELAQVLNVLGLPSGSTAQEIIKAIETLKSTSPSEKEVKESLSLAYGEGIISESEKKFYECAFTGNRRRNIMILFHPTGKTWAISAQLLFKDRSKSWP